MRRGCGYRVAVLRLRRRRDGLSFVIAAHARIGRAAGSGLVLDGTYASAEQAMIRFGGPDWELRDLGSQSATLVDGRRLAPREPARLDVGVVIELGDPDETWVVELADPPGIVAERVDGDAASAPPRGTTLGARDVLALPDAARPLATIFAAPGLDAPGDGYVLESQDGERRAVHDGDTVEVDGATWRVQLPLVVAGTPTLETARTLANVHLRFLVSSDEARVSLSIAHRHGTEVLPAQRHNRVLLTLARLRAQDKRLAAELRGWVERDRLLDMLELDSNALDVAIHAARSALSAAGIVDAGGIVEVRRGQRRLGTDRFKVVRG